MFIQVSEDENEDVVELPLEDNYTLSLATLQGQFPGAAGLKYRSPDTGAWRGLRIADEALAPAGNDWSGNHIYVVVYPKDNKRKGDGGEEMETDGPKTKRLNAKAKIPQGTTDLIVMNLAWKVDETQLRAYFEQYGELMMVQLKKDLEGKSRGFGFIRFKNLEDQGRVLAERHWIEGRSCDVKVPQSRTSGMDDVVLPGANQPHLSRRVFVGRVTEDITRDDLQDYFSKYGEITDIFVPKPHRMFAFVTFTDSESARALIELNEDHLIRGCSVNVAYASPMKPNEKKQQQHQQQDMGAGLMGSGANWAQPTGQYMQQMMGGGGRSKMPDNPMEAMGMAMAMMKTWESWKMSQDEEEKKQQRGRGGGGGGKGQNYGQSGWGNKPDNGFGYQSGYQSGYGGGYGGSGGVW